MAGEETVVPIADHEGKFSENWRESLPEDIRDAKCLETVVDFGNLVKQYVHSQKMIGKNHLAVPDKGADETAWHEFYKNVGKPETADDYPYSVPEDASDEFKDSRTPEYMKTIKERAFKNNLTAGQFKAIMAEEDEALKQSISEGDLKAESEAEAALKQLKDVWGAAAEERIHAVNRLIHQTVDEGQKRHDFIAKYGRDATFIEWAADIAKDYVEHEMLVAKLEQTTTKEAQAELNELMATDNYNLYMSGELQRTNLPLHQAMHEKVTNLYSVIYEGEEVTN